MSQFVCLFPANSSSHTYKSFFLFKISASVHGLHQKAMTASSVLCTNVLWLGAKICFASKSTKGADLLPSCARSITNPRSRRNEHGRNNTMHRLRDRKCWCFLGASTKCAGMPHYMYALCNVLLYGAVTCAPQANRTNLSISSMQHQDLIWRNEHCWNNTMHRFRDRKCWCFLDSSTKWAGISFWFYVHYVFALGNVLLDSALTSAPQANRTKLSIFLSKTGPSSRSTRSDSQTKSSFCTFAHMLLSVKHGAAEFVRRVLFYSPLHRNTRDISFVMNSQLLSATVVRVNKTYK